MNTPGKHTWKIGLLCGGLLWAAAVLANDAIEIVNSDISADTISDELVKLTWEAELNNTSDTQVTVTLVCDLFDADGATVHSLTIEDFSIDAKQTATAVQSRPVTTTIWEQVTDHQIVIE